MQRSDDFAPPPGLTPPFARQQTEPGKRVETAQTNPGGQSAARVVQSIGRPVLGLTNSLPDAQLPVQNSRADVHSQGELCRWLVAIVGKDGGCGWSGNLRSWWWRDGSRRWRWRLRCADCERIRSRRGSWQRSCRPADVRWRCTLRSSGRQLQRGRGEDHCYGRPRSALSTSDLSSSKVDEGKQEEQERSHRRRKRCCIVTS